MLKILIIGATSAIAHETVKHFATDGAELLLVGRNAAKLEAIKDDLLVRGAAAVHIALQDLDALDELPILFENALSILGGLDAMLIAHGTLGDQASAQADTDEMLREISTNFTSAAILLSLAANHMEAQKRGAITVISSVAGDRGRAKNYVYGSAMAAKTTFVGGLRNRLAKSGVQVLTVKPGFVDTPMTADVPKNALFADPADVGEAIYKAMKAKRDILYVPSFWMGIMFIIRNIPERIFKRLKL